MKSYAMRGLAVVALGLSGCVTLDRFYGDIFLPCKAQDISETTVALTVVSPWLDYITPLKTDFQLTNDKALQMAIPQTAAFISKVLDVTTLQAQVALQQHTLSSTTTETAGGSAGNTDATNTKESSQPGTVATSQAAVDSTKLSAAALPVASLPAASTDPFLLYETAAALKQEVAALNREVEDAELDHHGPV